MDFNMPPGVSASDIPGNQSDIKPGLYVCLDCRRTVEMADGDGFPQDTEKCEHQWELVPIFELGLLGYKPQS